MSESPSPSARATPSTQTTRPGADQSLVLVELFTSQGCSSCPPADRLLGELGAQADVVALSFHVDTWNYIGWRDPFSSSRWTERQDAYARRLAGDRSYTPQLVVQGRAETVGSRRKQVSRLIDGARQKRNPVALSVSATRTDASRATIEVAVDPGALTGASNVWLAVYESGVQTQVKRGENAGRTLVNDFIVRRLEPLTSLSPGGPSTRTSHRIALPDGNAGRRLGIAVFAQAPETLEIHAVARTELSAVP